MNIGKYDFKEVEEAMLKFWEEKSIHKKANQKNTGKTPFYFLDGPPYTSGRVHIGTAWNKSLKDSILKYKRMAGFEVWDRAGYDMHGLPTELKVSAKLNLKGKDDIPEYGVGKFIEECKKFSVHNLKMMNKDFERIGVWMDFDNAYQSIKNEFMEGGWWLVKKAHENDRLYEGEKVMHWCKDCATALAKHELEYANDHDESIFVKFPVKGKEKEFIIIWTTTPWTIPFNLGVMAHPELDYIKAKVDDETWIVAKGLCGALINGVADKKFEIAEEFKGEELKGLEYEHPFSKIVDYSEMKSIHPKIHTIVMSSEFVDLSAGSGLVHMAPGCGPEDYEIGKKNDIPPFNNLDENGVFPESMGSFKGLMAKTDDKKFIEALENEGVLIAVTPVEHDYAHCWRCKEPVIFRTTKQWFFKVEDLKEKMKELNKQVKWVPDWAGAKQFHSWLENLRDNGITRQRFWGTPVPIWKCEECHEVDVVGSVKELEELSGNPAPKDLHKPYIDEVSWKCSCGGTKNRIPDILDVWIDAGTTSWTCLDYPQKTENFDKLYPADFILEGKDQIRGWFNLLLVASMISMKVHSYKNCYMHGFVQDAMGRKMSKSLGNIISPYEVIDVQGADTLRYYSIGGARAGLDLCYNMDDAKVKLKNLGVLWNLHKYLIDYAADVGINPKEIDAKKDFGIEEKFMISRLNSTIKHVTMLWDNYRIDEIPLEVEELFLDLSRTYIQLTRNKVSSGSETDKKVVLYTIYTTLYESLKLLAPIAPFITEKAYLNLKKAFSLEKESIHLHDWPKEDPKLMDKELEHAFEHTKGIIQAALYAREKAQTGVRWPLSEIIIATEEDSVSKAVSLLKSIIKTQCNIKDLSVVKEFSEAKETMKADHSKIAPDFKENTPKIIARLAIESPESVLKHIKKDGKFPIKIDEQKFNITQEHIIIQKELPEEYVESDFRHGVVYLNKKMDKELEAEGFSREVMRRVQAMRKKEGFHKTDSIELYIHCSDVLLAKLEKHEAQIKEKVGASEITISKVAPKHSLKHAGKEKVKGEEFKLLFNKS